MRCFTFISSLIPYLNPWYHKIKNNTHTAIIKTKYMLQRKKSFLDSNGFESKLIFPPLTSLLVYRVKKYLEFSG